MAHATVDGRQAGHLGFRISYDREGGQVWTLYTTVVHHEFEGHGVGSALVRDVVRHADQSNALIDPTCWFVAGWLQRHAEFAHLLGDDLR